MHGLPAASKHASISTMILDLKVQDSRTPHIYVYIAAT